jgi:hypothetical protein
MIDLNKYYISSEYQGASGGSEGRSGFVPKALSGDELKFLRGDGTWQNVTGQTMIGATSSTDGQEGLVPKPLSGDNTKYLRGDGTWQNVSVASTVQYLQTSPTINLDIQEYDTFVVDVTDSITFTYSNFPVGKSINVYLSANHNSYIPHIFPENTKFSELGDDNTIYSFTGYTTRILLQNIGSFVINFSSVVKNLSSGGGGGGEGSGSGSGSDGGGVTGVGLDLLLLYLDEVFNL